MQSEIDDTPQNRSYVSAMHIRIADEWRFITAQVWLARLIGFGFFIILIGIVFLIGCLAYKNIYKLDDEAVISKSIKEALEGFVLKARTDGSVKIENPVVELHPNQTVAISDDSTIRIADGETVKVKGEVSVALPFQNQNSSMPLVPSGQTQKAVQTNSPYFTVFKTMPYKSGFIYTGWQFLSTQQKFPTIQYCYYSEKDWYSDTTAIFEFAQDGALKDKLNPPPNVNISEAMDLCIWFSKSGDQ